MRNLLKAFGLLLLLITAQQGAVVHELSHYSAAGSGGDVNSGTATTSGHGTTALDVDDADVRSASGVAVADANCALCPAFAQVVTPAFSHAFHLPLLDRADVQRSPDPRYGAAETAALTPRSRGPPSLS